MSEYEYGIRARHTVTCDRCCLTHASEVYDAYRGGARRHLDLLAAEGWRIYVGRSRRHYCPSCRPNPGHRMRLVLGVEAADSDG